MTNSEKIKHIVQLSGGKDSTALLLRLIELHENGDIDYDIDEAVAEKTAEIENRFANEKKQAVKEAKEKALAKAEKNNQQELEKAKAAVKSEIEEKYKSQIADAETAKAEALEKAKTMASKLDKNADADLVTASVYFGEVQKALDSFLQSTAKVSKADAEKGKKLNALACNTLNNYIDKLSNI